METNVNVWIIVLSILGAAAWIPQLIQLGIKIFTKTSITIINHKEIEIGYNTLGPIINFNLAFLAENEKALINKIELELKHTSNETHKFKWIWYEESLFQMDIPRISIPYKKNQIAIALNVPKDFLVEKKIGFQSHEFKKKVNGISKLLKEEYANLKNSDKDISELKASKNYNDLIDHFNNSFLWKTGEYTIEISIFITKRGKPFSHMMSFELSNIDIRKLKDNIPYFKDKVAPNYSSSRKF